MCSYHNKDRKLPGKHGSIKSSVFIGYHEEWKFYDNLLSLHKTPKRTFDCVYWILKMCPMFIRMLIVIRIMLICSYFIRINMLWMHLKLNFIFGVNAKECKEYLCLCTCKKVRITKNSFSKVFLMTGKSNFSNIFCIKAAKVRKSTADNHADELHVLIEIALLHGSLL